MCGLPSVAALATVGKEFVLTLLVLGALQVIGRVLMSGRVYWLAKLGKKWGPHLGPFSLHGSLVEEPVLVPKRIFRCVCFFCK